MPKVDQLNWRGDAAIELPRDTGDRPVLSAPPDSSAAAPNMASIKEYFRLRGNFEDNIITDNWFLGPSSHIALGRFHVSDTLQPNSFRRVHQIFSYQPTPALEGNFVVVFAGAGMAIARQGDQVLAAAAAGASPPGALARAIAAADTANTVMDTLKTVPVNATTYQIHFRMPGYEPNGDGLIHAPDPHCIATNSEEGRRLLSQNSIVRFNLGNSNAERKIVPITYPVGRSIPVIFDVVNATPTHRITVDLMVGVFIDRSHLNEERKRRKD